MNGRNEPRSYPLSSAVATALCAVRDTESGEWQPPQGRHGQLDLCLAPLSQSSCLTPSSLRRQQFERDTEPLRGFFAILEYANVDRRTLS